MPSDINDISGITDDFQMGSPLGHRPPTKDEVLADLNQMVRPHDAFDPDEGFDREFHMGVLWNEMQLAKDLGTRTVTAGKNLAANIVGLPGDVLSLMAMLYASQPLYGAMAKQKLGVDSVWDIAGKNPIGADRIAKALGGDPEDITMLATGVVAPGPGEFFMGAKAFVGASVLGAVGMRRAGQITRLDTFLKLDEAANGGKGLPLYDQEAYTQTGWYWGEDGKARFWLSDADATVKMGTVNKHILNLGKDALEAAGGRVYVKLGDVFQHKELYKIYPEIKNLRVELAVEVQDWSTGAFKIKNSARPELAGSLSNVAGNPNKLKLENIDDNTELRETLLHEIQHVIQRVEGFATGTSQGQMSKEAIDSFVAGRAYLDAIKILDGGVDNVDDLAKELAKTGWSEAEVDALLDDTGSPVLEYLAAQFDGDSIQMNEILTEVNGAVKDSGKDLVHLLHYLGLKEHDSVQELATQLGDRLRYVDFEALKRQAYLHSAGEAEARLVQISGDLRTHPAVPNPNRLESITQKLSVGEVRKPATVVPSELADIPVVETPSWIRSADDSVMDLPAISKQYKKILKEFPDVTPERIAKNQPAAAALDDGINDVYISNTAYGVVREKKQVQVMKNPTVGQLKRWNLPKDEEGEILLRVITDVEGNHYVWPADDALHHDFIQKTGIVAHWGDDWTDVDGMPIEDLIRRKELGFTMSELDNYKPTVSVDESSKIIREASDPMANWTPDQDSTRGGVQWGPANDVPNESNLISELPEGTHNITDADTLNLLANTDDPDEVRRILDGLVEPSAASTRGADDGLRAKRDALAILMDKNSVGEKKEAARKVLTGSRFKPISKERLFELADELGMLD